jgi:RND family efflux transporter MFP subunit
VLAALLTLGLGLLLLVLAGVFKQKVPTNAVPPQRGPADRPLAEVRLIRRPRYETAVGTVRAVHEAGVAARLLARVTEVHIKAGQAVRVGQVLVRLDDSDLRARLKQAEAAVVAARAARQKAIRDHERGRALLPGGGISREDFDQRQTARRTTAAELERAEHSVREAGVLLDYALVRAPLTGVVIDKRVEVGDTARPGQVLLTLYDPTRMQMVASVRESLALRLQVGQKLPARLEALDRDCRATVSEIVPEAQPASRSFAVKVTGPCPPGAYSGMFGRIFIPLDDERIVAVPAAAVYHVGQLDMIDVQDADAVRRRSIQLGRRIGASYEVLAGLRTGEKIVLRKRQEEGRP